MGSNNASKSTSAYSARNYSTILRSGTTFKLGYLDVSERQLLLDLIVDRTLQRPIKIPRASHERMSVEDFWSTIWG